MQRLLDSEPACPRTAALLRKDIDKANADSARHLFAVRPVPTTGWLGSWRSTVSVGHAGAVA